MNGCVRGLSDCQIANAYAPERRFASRTIKADESGRHRHYEDNNDDVPLVKVLVVPEILAIL
jgi:hypothetical protein